MKTDNIKTLLEKGEYSLVKDLTKDSKDGESLYFRVSALIALNETIEARKIIEDNKKLLYDFEPLGSMKASFGLRFLKEEFDEAYEDYSFYSNLPYVSQEVEEYLRSLPKLIRMEEKASILGKKASEKEPYELLKEAKSDYERFLVISSLRKKDLPQCISEIKKIIGSDKANESLKTYAFLMLVSASFDEEVVLHKHGEETRLNPSKCFKPFEGEKYQKAKETINGLAVPPVLKEGGASLLDQAILASYPKDILDANPLLIGIAITYLYAEFIQAEYPLDELLESSPDIDRATLMKLVEELSESLSRETPLSY